MNRHLLHVLLIYVIALLVVLVYVPWYGQSLGGVEETPWLEYRFIWSPPRASGYRIGIDFGRMFLEAVSLSVVMLAGAIWLWGEE